MALIEELLLGTVFSALVQAIFEAKKKATFFKKTLENLQATVRSVRPIIEQINRSENAPSDTLRGFVQQLKKAKVVVNMYSEMEKLNFLEKRKVKKLIKEIDASLQRFLARDFQVEQLLYLTMIHNRMIEIEKKMDRFIALLGENRSEILITEPETDEDILSSSPDNSPSDVDPDLGAVLGGALLRLDGSIIHAKAEASSSKLEFQLKLLETKVGILARKFNETINSLVTLQESCPEEIQKLQDFLEKAIAIVSDCSGVSKWKLYTIHNYKRRLIDLNESFDQLLRLSSTAAGYRYIRQILANVNTMMEH